MIFMTKDKIRKPPEWYDYEMRQGFYSAQKRHLRRKRKKHFLRPIKNLLRKRR